MTKYAQFDPKSDSPAQVIGWYDTDIFEYPNLPPSGHVIEVSEMQWALHFSHPNGWHVDNGTLIPPEHD